MPLIAINAFQVLNRSGTGYYSRRIIEHVPAVDADLRYLMLLPSAFRANPLCGKLAEAPNVRLRFVSVATQTKRILFEHLVLPRLLSKAKVDLLHSLAFVAPPHLLMRSVVTVHDLTFKLFPETLTGVRRYYLARATERSIRDADRVIVVSHAVKSDVIHHLQTTGGKVAAVHEGGFDSRGLASRLESRYLAHLLEWDGDYVLFIGTMEPRKNLERLLSAFSVFRNGYKPDCKLVIVGRKGWLNDSIQQRLAESSIERDVIFTGFLPDSVVISLMRAASVYVMPSLYEGFGLPLVTAMACGTPIAASNAGSIPEIVGAAGLLFDPLDVDAIAESLRQILSSPELASRLVEAGKRRRLQFSWQKCARETVDIYKSTLSA